MPWWHEARRRLTPGAQTLLTSIAVGCLGALTGVLVARLLGPSSRGELAAVVSWSGFALGIATLGVDDALTYHGPAFLRRPGFPARALATWSACVAVGAGLVAALVVIALPVPLDARASIAIAVGLGGAALVMQNCLTGLLVGLGNYPAWHRARLLGPAVYALGTAALFLADEDSLQLVVVMVCLSWSAPLIPASVAARRLVAQTPQVNGSGPGSTRRERRALFRYGVRAQTAKLSTQANMRLDQVLLVFFVSTSKLGLYAVAATLATLTPNLLYQAHARLTFGRLRRISETRPLERADARRTAVRALALILAVQGVIALTAPFVVPLLFGDGFRDAGPIASALALATVPFAVSRMLQSWSMAAGEVARVARIEVLAVGLQLALILALCSGPLGVWGAVLASAVSYSVSMVLQARLARRYAA